MWTSILNGVVIIGISYFSTCYVRDRVNEVRKLRADLDDLSVHLLTLKQDLEDAKNE